MSEIKEKLEDRIRRVLRRKQYSMKTEECYIGWYKRFVLWHGKRHPETMGTREVEDFLTHLAADLKVAAATQNQALNSLIFLYREVLKVELEGIDAQRAKVTRRLPVVLTKEEVGQLLKGVEGEAGLACKLGACAAAFIRDASHSARGGYPEYPRATGT